VDDIKAAFPGIQVTRFIGRRSSFEVSVKYVVADLLVVFNARVMMRVVLWCNLLHSAVVVLHTAVVKASTPSWEDKGTLVCSCVCRTNLDIAVAIFNTVTTELACRLATLVIFNFPVCRMSRHCRWPSHPVVVTEVGKVLGLEPKVMPSQGGGCIIA